MKVLLWWKMDFQNRIIILFKSLYFQIKEEKKLLRREARKAVKSAEKA